MSAIKFYSTTDEFGEFSNFSMHAIYLNGEWWPTSEHYFQAQKFENLSYREKIRKANTPMEAARLGRSRREKLRKNWETIKIKVMEDAVLAKFKQHSDLRDILVSTEERDLVEHTENDSYWGDGGDGKGKNMLGKILMRVRKQLQEA